MLLHSFPDINFVRKLRNKATLPGEDWRNVALNIKCKEVCRTGIESPLSLFMNISGHSFCAINGFEYRIETDQILLVHPGDIYNLLVDNLNTTEIFNIHINQTFFSQTAFQIMAPTHLQLDAPEGVMDALNYLPAQLYPKNEGLQTALTYLQQSDPEEFETSLHSLIKWLLLSSNEIKKKIECLPHLSAPLKVEIYQRLSKARDRMHSCYADPLSLEMLAKDACLSRFHFLRLFQLVHGCAPLHYLTEVRLQKAKELLRHTNLSVQDIAIHSGFTHSASLIRAYRKRFGNTPFKFRHSIA